jgi:hypothetical protein
VYSRAEHVFILEHNSATTLFSAVCEAFNNEEANKARKHRMVTKLRAKEVFTTSNISGVEEFWQDEATLNRSPRKSLRNLHIVLVSLGYVLIDTPCIVIGVKWRKIRDKR